MSPQLFYALRKVAIAVVLSTLGVLAAHQTDVVTAAGQDPLVVGAVITALLGSAVRVVEGYRDGQRAAGTTANMQPSDVGYEQVQELLYRGPDVKPVISQGSTLDLEVVNKNPFPVVPDIDGSYPVPYSILNQ